MGSTSRCGLLVLVLLPGWVLGETRDEEARVVQVEPERLRVGVTWYRVEGGGGTRRGFGMARISAEPDGGRRLDLQMNATGGTTGPLEERWSVNLDDGGQLCAASYEVTGTRISERQSARMEGGEFKIEFTHGGETSWQFHTRLPAGALPLAVFFHSGMLKAQAGARVSIASLDCRSGFMPEATSTLEIVERRELLAGDPSSRVWYAERRGDGRIVDRIWLADGGQIVRLESRELGAWVRADGPTIHLGRAIEAPVVKLSGSGERSTATLEMKVGGVSAQRLLMCWLDSTIARKWWKLDVEIEDMVGGAYVLRDPEIPWELRGRIARLEPGKQIMIEWRDPQDRRLVDFETHVTVTDSSEGSTLELDETARTRSIQDSQKGKERIRFWAYYLQELARFVE